MMRSKNTIKIIAMYAAYTPANALFAHDLHDGQGILGSHWHSSDVMGYVVLAIAVALTLWLSRGDK
jgi:hypothetical protein